MFKPQQEYRRCVAETFKDLPSSAVVAIDSLLPLEAEVRGTAASALQSDVSCAILLRGPFAYQFKEHMWEVQPRGQRARIPGAAPSTGNFGPRF
jgi:hypothetical protein